MTVLESSKAIYDALSCLRPYDIDRRKLRCGSSEDGGYVFAHGIRPSQPILSLGVGWNCDLEFQFAEEGHPITMFDPTVDAPPRDHANFVFHKIGVAGRDSEDGEYLSLESIIKLSKLDGRDDLVLKMDVEGAEFASIAHTSAASIRRFEQIVIEIHWLTRLTDPEYREDYMKAMKLLNDNFIIYHVHANNCAPLRFIGGIQTLWEPIGGFAVADVLELSLIRSDLAVASPSQTFYPTSLDCPNHNLSPDHMLAFYPFLPMSPSTEKNVEQAAHLNDMRYSKAIGE